MGPLQVAPQKPLKEDAPLVDISNVKLSSPPDYKIGESVATRFAYGTALAKIAASNDHVIALDGDTKNSTYSDRLKKVRILKFPCMCCLEPTEFWLHHVLRGYILVPSLS
jgi:Transketolase, C-terminal subunit